VAVVAVAVVGLAHVHLRWRPATLCPLRALTGIPCPLCGTTTAAVRLGSGDVVGALRTAPVPLAAGLALLTAPLGTAAAWWRCSPRARLVVLGAALVVAEVWQLVRFGVI
jgi:hypothetical protein